MSAFLDVSDVLLDPTFTNTFTVNRRVEVIDSNGRPSVTTTVYPNVIGVICAASNNDLMRLPEDDQMGRNMSVVTKFHVQGPSPGVKADTIVWHGDTYIVKYVDVYTQYGAGFVEIIMGSMDSVDTPP